MTLCALIPDVDLLLALPPEQVGRQRLKLADQAQQNGIFSRGAVIGADRLSVTGSATPAQNIRLIEK